MNKLMTEQPLFYLNGEQTCLEQSQGGENISSLIEKKIGEEQ